MSWKKKKVYGEYKTANCAFCGKTATQETDTGLQVCPSHQQAQLKEIKCTCGSWLEQRAGKFGPYFNCINCGNINFQKGMQIQELTKSKELVSKGVQSVKTVSEKEESKITRVVPQRNELNESTQKSDGVTSFEKQAPSVRKQNPKEITISTNDVEYFS